MSRVLAIGFDSASATLVEDGIATGWLPNLRRLRERGTYGRLRTTSEWLVSSHWASFSLGAPPNEHGCYHFLQWRADAMGLKRLDPAWMIREPFWRDLRRGGTARVVALDVPYTPRPRTGDGGAEASGWATNEIIFEPYAEPRWLRDRIREAYGRSPRKVGQALAFEKFAPRPLPELLRLADQLVDVTERSSRLVCSLMRERPWDLFLTVFGAAHRAGHLLWSAGSVEGAGGPEVDSALREALRAVYVACDRAIGRVVDEAGEDATVIVFSLIGMGPNTSRTDLLPAMLARILSRDSRAAAAHERLSLSKRLRGLVPLEWRHASKASLPLALQDKLSLLWRVGRPDWGRTHAMSLTADVHGYVRINLRGREAEGIVEPGEEYDRLCREIAEGLMSFTDVATGEPVVVEVRRIDELFPGGGRRDALPDLIVRWAPSPSAATAGIASPGLGRIEWPLPGKNPNGRSGNHTAEAFVLAAGGSVRRGATLPGGHIFDLPPTILALLGHRQPSFMHGSAIPEIALPLATPRSIDE